MEICPRVVGGHPCQHRKAFGVPCESRQVLCVHHVSRIQRRTSCEAYLHRVSQERRARIMRRPRVRQGVQPCIQAQPRQVHGRFPSRQSSRSCIGPRAWSTRLSSTASGLWKFDAAAAATHIAHNKCYRGRSSEGLPVTQVTIQTPNPLHIAV